MPTVGNVRLTVDPEEEKILRATITADVRMSALEECIADRCLKGLNEEFLVEASIHAEDWGAVDFRPLMFFASQRLAWENPPVQGFSFTKLVVVGGDLNEDWGVDEVKPRVGVRTRAGGIVVSSAWGPTVTGRF